jgi:hypothetical protein
MSQDPNIEPLSPQERELEQRLLEQRPLPHPGFRSMLRNRLLTQPGTAPTQPRRLRLLIATYATGGLALLAFAAVGVFGAGPLAA